MLAKDPTRETLVIVPSLKLKEDWTDPKTGHIVRFGLTNVRVHVINGFIQHTLLMNVHLLVLDEAHNYASEQFYKVFTIVNYKWILGLTATIDRKDGRDVLIRQHCPVFDQVTMEEARREGYISQFLTFNLEVKFSISEARQYESFSNTMNAMFARFGHNFDLAKNAAGGIAKGGDKIRLGYAQSMGWKPSDGDSHEWSPKSIAKYAIQWNRAVQARKKLLYQSKSKLLAAQAVLQLLPLKTITFSESTEFADALTAEHPACSRAYHSNIASKRVMGKSGKLKGVSGKAQNKQALLDLNNPASPVRIINTAKALDEGFDVEDIELALICSSTSAIRQNIQRTGRAVRFVAGKTALIINLYHPDTQDEKWLKERQKTTRQTIWLSDIRELTRHLPTADAE